MGLPTVIDVAALDAEALPHALLVPRLPRAFHVTTRPPGSKSITNRALLLAALAHGSSTLRGALLDADDARVMIAALEALGASIAIEQSREDRALGNATLRVSGVAGRWKPRSREPVLNLHNAGTATRFLAAAAILSDPAAGPITIDGNARMRQRPIAELVDALRQLGARADYLSADGRPPIRVFPIAPDHPREITLGRTSSGQFISALLLIAPFLPRGLALRLAEPPTSEPYISMTLRLLQRLGGHPDSGAAAPAEAWTLATTRRFEPARFDAFDLDIEPDYSGAAPLWSAAAVIPGATMTITTGTPTAGPSLQGDATFLESVLAAGFGAAAARDAAGARCTGAPTITPQAAPISLADIPDTAMCAAAVACFASPSPGNPAATTVLRGLRTLRVKETDRLAALQSELSRIGATIEIETTRDDEALRITPPPDLASSPLCRPASVAPPPIVEFDTYDDHRMAMALALIGLRRGNVVIRDPACVRKTYPAFWRDLARLYTGSPT